MVGTNDSQDFKDYLGRCGRIDAMSALFISTDASVYCSLVQYYEIDDI